MYFAIIAAVMLAFACGPIEPREGFSAAHTLLGTVALTLVCILLAHALSAWALRAFPTDYLARNKFLKRYYRLLTIHRVLLVAAYGLSLHWLQWPVVIGKTWSMANWVLMDEFLMLLPFLLALVLSWVALFRVDKRLRGATWGLGEYLVFHSRHYLGVIVLPIFFFFALFDIASLLLGSRLEDPFVHWPLAVALVLSMYAFAPLGLRVIWRTTPLPDGPLRRDLEAMMQRVGLRCRDILVWETGGGRIANACIAGVFPGLRYVFLSDALLWNLAPDEIAAIFGHELGHAKHRHIPFYVVFCLAFAFFSAAIEANAGSLVKGAPLALLTLVLYWGVIFGFLSRRLERQADIYGARLVGDMDTFIRSLEKIAYLNGMTRKLRSWRHFTIAKRVAFLDKLRQDPSVERKFERELRLWIASFMVGALICLAVTVHVYLPQFRAAAERLLR